MLKRFLGQVANATATTSGAKAPNLWSERWKKIKETDSMLLNKAIKYFDVTTSDYR